MTPKDVMISSEGMGVPKRVPTAPSTNMSELKAYIESTFLRSAGDDNYKPSYKTFSLAFKMGDDFKLQHGDRTVDIFREHLFSAMHSTFEGFYALSQHYCSPLEMQFEGEQLVKLEVEEDGTNRISATLYLPIFDNPDAMSEFYYLYKQ